MKTTADKVAARFSAILRSWLCDEDMRDINEANQKEPQFCATHDYVDSNQAMIDAWQIETGRDWSADDDECHALTEAAWVMAKASGFALIPDIGEGEQLRAAVADYQQEHGLEALPLEVQAQRLVPSDEYLKDLPRMWHEYQMRVMNGLEE